MWSSINLACHAIALGLDKLNTSAWKLNHCNMHALVFINPLALSYCMMLCDLNGEERACTLIVASTPFRSLNLKQWNNDMDFTFRIWNQTKI